MDTEFAALLAGKLFEGLKTTLLLLVICGIAGNLLAVPVALARISSHRLLRMPAYCFILVMRGTPVLVQLYLIYYGLGELLGQMPSVRHSMLWPYLRSGIWYAVLALTLNTSAYCGEILRGALTHVASGQIEAAKSLGMRPLSIMMLVVVPQAIRAALPALAGQNILLLKATSLASVVLPSAAAPSPCAHASMVSMASNAACWGTAWPLVNLMPDWLNALSLAGASPPSLQAAISANQPAKIPGSSFCR